MFKVLNKQILAKDVKRLDVKAPLIAARIAAGQFVMIVTREGGEWIPMMVAEAESLRGQITFIFQENNPAAVELGQLTIGEEIFSMVGPLGQPAKIAKTGVVVCLATGVGTARILPICKALKKAGNKVIGIMGAKTKNSLTLEPQMRIACSRLLITTEDGSYEQRGLASEMLKDILASEVVRQVYAAGSAEMMQAVCQMTKDKAISTLVQLQPVMACGMGFCGSCRVRVEGKVVLACVSGPLFDGHSVNFEHYKTRLAVNQAQKVNQDFQHEEDDMTRSITKFFPGLLGK
ncbi:MAG: sulfide/dihydroorotate dehydrogenase-like FAD/NAD-binding protein [Candidatus Omnitrophica bacterium]|nr:sulfide/dihydroorotate dehydrogenase-like FAD/NAD-binding protein [Candidatus Omnitrophota bacterium]